MLVEEQVPNASGKGNSRLANPKSLSSHERQTLVLECKGIMGVGFQDTRKSLNRKWLAKQGKRMGPTMIEVGWHGENGQTVLTWETREGWQKFRGKESADKEINFYARCRAEGKDPTEEFGKIKRQYRPGTSPCDMPEFDYSDYSDEEETPKLWRRPLDYTDSEPSTPCEENESMHDAGPLENPPVGTRHQERHRQGGSEENEPMHDAGPLEDRQHSALHGHVPPEQHGQPVLQPALNGPVPPPLFQPAPNGAPTSVPTSAQRPRGPGAAPATSVLPRARGAARATSVPISTQRPRAPGAAWATSVPPRAPGAARALSVLQPWALGGHRH